MATSPEFDDLVDETMDQRLMTRAEWEELVERENEESERQAMRSPDAACYVSLCLSALDIDRQSSGQLVSLLDLKLQQAKERLLSMVEKRREALKDAGR